MCGGEINKWRAENGGFPLLSIYLFISHPPMPRLRSYKESKCKLQASKSKQYSLTNIWFPSIIYGNMIPGTPCSPKCGLLPGSSPSEPSLGIKILLDVKSSAVVKRDYFLCQNKQNFLMNTTFILKKGKLDLHCKKKWTKRSHVDAVLVYSYCYTKRVYLATVRFAGLHLAAQQEISGVKAKDITACSEIYDRL